MAGGVVAILAAVFFIARGRSILPTASVGSLLKKLDGNYTVLTGSIVQGEQGMIRIDYAVVSSFGLFIIKECPEAGRVEVRLNREAWRVSGGSSGKLYNPVWSIRKVIQKLERLVGDFPYIPLVVFTRGRLKGDRDINVLEARNLIGHIQSFADQRLSEDQQKKIVGILG